MRIQTNHPDTRDQLGLQREQNEVVLSSLRKSSRLAVTPAVVSSPSQTSYDSGPYATYPSQNGGPYHQAIRAYQEASRFEPVKSVPLIAQGAVVGNEARGNEKALTEILQEDPGNGSAWYDLGLLYSEQGKREKVSAVYQVLQKIDSAMADGFSTQLGLHEKWLLDVA